VDPEVSSVVDSVVVGPDVDEVEEDVDVDDESVEPVDSVDSVSAHPSVSHSVEPESPQPAANTKAKAIEVVR
jgi:hypothetical protein